MAVYRFEPYKKESNYDLFDSDFTEGPRGRFDTFSATITSDTTPVGDKYVRFNTSETHAYADGGDRWFQWNGVPTNNDGHDILFCFRRDHATDTEILGAARYVVDTNDELNTWAGGLRNNETDLRGRLLVEGVLSNAGSEDHNLSTTVNTWIWCRVRVEKGSHVYKARTWDDGDDEPSDWLLEWTDTGENLGNGGIGLSVYVRIDTRNVDLAYLSVGTDGDSAPMPTTGPATPTNLQGTPSTDSILWTWEAGS